MDPSTSMSAASTTTTRHTSVHRDPMSAPLMAPLAIAPSYCRVGWRCSSAPLDLSRVFLHGAQYTGTSGSRIGDQQRVVDKTLAGELSPRHALAAVGGIEAAADGLHALMESRFPGKIVIFPQLRSLPLTSLEDLAAADPQIAAALGEDGAWTTEAEAVLFARYWSADAA